MIDVEKQASHWRSGAVEDWEVAEDLIGRERVRHGLFFAHLALEKALKAHVCLRTRDLAPRLHNLVRLAELAGVDLTPGQRDTLADMNAFALEGRYPEATAPAPGRAEGARYLDRAREMWTCLMKL